MEPGSTQKSGATTTPMKRVPTSDRCSIARESGEPSQMGKQKTASAGAPRDDATIWARVAWAPSSTRSQKAAGAYRKGCGALTTWPRYAAGVPNRGTFLECLG